MFWKRVAAGKSNVSQRCSEIRESLAKSHNEIDFIWEKVLKVSWQFGFSLSPAGRVLICCLLCIICFGLQAAVLCNPAIHLPKSTSRPDVPNVPPWALQELQFLSSTGGSAVLVLHRRICCWVLPCWWSWELSNVCGINPTQHCRVMDGPCTNGALTPLSITVSGNGPWIAREGKTVI